MVNDSYRIEIKDKFMVLGDGAKRDVECDFHIEIRSDELGKYLVVFKSGFHGFLNSCPGIGELANMLPNCTNQLSEFLVIDEPEEGLVLAKNTLYNDALLLILEELARYSGEPVETLFELIQSQLLRDLNIILLRDSHELDQPVGEYLVFESINRESVLRVKQDESSKTIETIDIKRLIGTDENSEFELLKHDRWLAPAGERRYKNTGLNYTKYCIDENESLERYEFVHQSVSSQQNKNLSRCIERLK
ncbi:hypothetical protein N480_14470 [Pseudoalteromonas luteoviolacea S2607]|uniref:hypothetical protein n=1 Tax=Pseudoalteromonas luteoviolacea TaxID=43657 RepID=UPI0007B0483A|nr:hypothetical protein [Pseudoalteromonas luteoviolacea]KZN37945.1 hypothetical protein N480_14470 [Pseudoalteromonas luteoviolacea S2607]